jgi:hypothetical protein
VVLGRVRSGADGAGMLFILAATCQGLRNAAKRGASSEVLSDRGCVEEGRRLMKGGPATCAGFARGTAGGVDGMWEVAGRLREGRGPTSIGAQSAGDRWDEFSSAASFRFVRSCLSEAAEVLSFGWSGRTGERKRKKKVGQAGLLMGGGVGRLGLLW